MNKQTRKVQKKKAVKQAASPEVKQAISDAERYAMIAESAYLIAERRGFQGEAALDDWLLAEAEINTRLSTSK